MAMDTLWTTASNISQPVKQAKLQGQGEELQDIVERLNKIVAVIQCVLVTYASNP